MRIISRNCFKQDHNAFMASILLAEAKPTLLKQKSAILTPTKFPFLVEENNIG